MTVSDASLPSPTSPQRYGWLTVLILLALTCSLSVGIFLLNNVERRLLVVAGQELMAAAVEVSDKLDQLLYERYRDSEMIANSFGRHVRDRVSMTEYLKWVQTTYEPAYLWLGVVDHQGIVIASTDDEIVGQDFSRSSWFKSARSDRKIIAEDVGGHLGDNGVNTVAFSAPMFDEQGRFQGVLTSRIALPAVEAVVTGTARTLANRSKFSKLVEYKILSRTGEAFVDSNLDHKGKLNLRSMNVPSALASLEGRMGFVEEAHENRSEVVVTGHAVTRGRADFPGFNWSVLMRMDRSIVIASIRSMLWEMVAIGVLACLPLVVLLIWMTVRLRGENRQAQQEGAWARVAEMALLQSQERNLAIIETALDGVITIDAAGIITDWNTQTTAIFGWTRTEALGQPLSHMVIPPRDRDAYERGLREYFKTGVGSILNRRIEIMAQHKDGREFPVELSVSPARVGESYMFSAFVRNITDRRRAERRLASQYAVTRVLGVAGTLEEAMPRIMEAVGNSLEWDLGVFWRLDKQAGRLRCLNHWKASSIGAEEFIRVTAEKTFQRGEGLPGRIWESGVPIWVTDVMCDSGFLRATAMVDEELRGAFGFPIRVAGEIEGVIEFFSRQVEESDEELLKMMADIGLKIGQFGERARAEDALRQAETQLRQSQKMEAIGRLAGGVAHDFNNLLTVIRGYSELILARMPQEESSRRDMEEVKKAADRAAGLTRQLLAFSRRQLVAAKIINVNAIVMNMDTMLRRLIGEDIIELWTDLEPDVWSIKADPGQIEQVVMNLAVNARDAMPTGGRLTIETRNIVVQKGTHQDQVLLEAGSYVMLALKDSGLGMTKEVQAHLFEPFYTTKESGKGTGLGLSTVYGIVKQSGGTIAIESQPGRGTVCKIYFPRVTDSIQESDAPQKEGRTNHGQETILLVEDDPSVRGFVHETLKMNGYQVLVARHGIEALLVGTRHMGPIHLLLTDVVMPQMSGPEVAEKLTTLRPDAKVLYMSGYPDHPVFKKGEVQLETNFIQKPFTPDALLEKVREVLDRVKVG
ncbi:MAG: PAS domain S-box protein [Nitrospira sp.]|nr:PAS domain S-box protein [Nitrospira sp.]